MEGNYWSLYPERDEMSVEELRKQLTTSKQLLSHANRQINNLDKQINNLKKLFRRAERNNGNAIRYNLRMQLSISSGVKVMFHHFASSMEKKIANLNAKLDNSVSSLSPLPNEEKLRIDD
ncbi:hypothetical protein NPIL_440141 [Nephila pilipes]|uniref:Uncharacterized protein n=1 Tax=Nephila pilipes TaxID=299642 RepID=A0A8X6QYL8_NEPPI|nr:hypothetical protein NPIL_440141 [Nephila pilipes]